MTVVDPMVAGIRDDLAAALGRPDLELTSAARLTAGASRFTWMLETTCGGGETEHLVLQRERVRGASFGRVPVEAAMLRAAAAAGVPVPEVVAVDPVGDSVDGAYVVTRRVEGETIARRILRDDAYAPARAGFAAEAGRILARIHSVPTDGLPLSEPTDLLAGVATMLDDAYDARPALEVGLRWLREHRPPAGPVTLVHGDFRLGNLIVGPDGVRAVLDWELAHVGDPMEDLGWLSCPSWRFRGPEPVAGMGSREDLWRAYEEAGGRPVDPEAARWWEVCATVRWGAMCLKQAQVHLSGLSPSVELALIGRRAAQCEHDLFEAVFPGPPAVPAPAARPPDLYGRPTAVELVAAVREQLQAETGSFRARVAANALHAVERELVAGDRPEREHRERLAALGFEDDAALSAAVRDGTVELTQPLLAAVRADVAHRLAVYDPSYGGERSGR